MARYEPLRSDAPKLPPATAMRTLARIGAFLRPYRRQVVYAAIALVVAAAAVLAVGQGLRGVIDRGFATGDPAQLDRTLALMLGVVAGAQPVAARRWARHARVDEREAHAARARRRAGRRRADHPVRPPRAKARPGIAGSRRRCRCVPRRIAARDPHRAGVR